MAEGDNAVDWREMRARLVAQAAGQKAPSAGFVYESPLIEQGTILLGGTQLEFGFALRQQFFHKCVLLLLEHNEGFTKGIILNRPSELQLDGWRVWCGHGQVGDGGLFAGADAVKGDLEINCLHALEGTLPERLSTRVIKGVSYTDLAGAKELVAAGVAQRSDFWVCVGYSGWAPGQLQSEVDERSWHLAAADSGTLLKQLLRQAAELPPPEAAATVAVTTGRGATTGLAASTAPAAATAATAAAAVSEAADAADPAADAAELDALTEQYLDAERELAASAASAASDASDASAASERQLQELLRSGSDTWSSLMASIGREADVRQAEGGLADRMLGEWVREHLLPKPAALTPSTPPPLVTVGTALLATVGASGRPAARFLLREQFMHKGLLLVLQADADSDGALLCAVLNRPTSASVSFNLPGRPSRRLPICGSLPLPRSLAKDGQGQLWLHHRAELGGSALGSAGVYVLPTVEAAALLKEEKAAAADFLIVGGVVSFGRAELAGMLAAGEMRVLPPGEQLSALWPRVWALAHDDGSKSPPSDGTEVWWLASQCGSEQGTQQGHLAAPPPAGIADEALEEWLSWFARDPPSDRP